MVSHSTDPEVVPTMMTTDVQTVISDSGHTRYRIVAKLWNMFEEAKEPHWTFPHGVTCEELDNNFKTLTTIKCDSAYFDKGQALWTLTGHVRLTNATGDVVLTDQLLWDQRTHRLIYSLFYFRPVTITVKQPFLRRNNIRTTGQIKYLSLVADIGRSNANGISNFQQCCMVSQGKGFVHRNVYRARSRIPGCHEYIHPASRYGSQNRFTNLIFQRI